MGRQELETRSRLLGITSAHRLPFSRSNMTSEERCACAVVGDSLSRGIPRDVMGVCHLEGHVPVEPGSTLVLPRWLY